MIIQDLIPLGPKTTMRIGGKALYYAEILTEADVGEAWKFSQDKKIPLIVLGGGSNTIFADDVIHALVVRIKADAMTVDDGSGHSSFENGNGHSAFENGSGHSARVTIEAGKILGSLLNELAAKNLDLSALTGIPGSLGGAIFGNAGQGAKGIWIDSFVESVTAFVDGEWKTFTREECKFRYRESYFKDHMDAGRVGAIRESPSLEHYSVIIWKATLKVPSRPEADVKAEIERLIQKRIETQPHIKTAGSCFKSLPDRTPAWKLIDAAGLRGTKIGGIQISEKHANFLLNVEGGTFEDAKRITALIKEKVPRIAGIEMCFYSADGKIN